MYLSIPHSVNCTSCWSPAEPILPKLSATHERLRRPALDSTCQAALLLLTNKTLVPLRILTTQLPERKKLCLRMASPATVFPYWRSFEVFRWPVSLNVLDASFSTAKFGLYNAILKEVSDWHMRMDMNGNVRVCFKNSGETEEIYQTPTSRD